ncbi:2-amino-4-hydroxy-6-hydroxymethyldihydropteridine diphosphokinase [Campylobacter sp. FMV-PI01]|uniref:2-amino-4-hydroxy-6-hydroxymethyldihydropteridine pyrophosphokinase n=1 Tax=Campylobacter portucalensis TaxID=2608384 RepID=A0A6L5WL95_9BACT|nr:2-amino-4-hydroxy-6-hydroxymethyldihydropteridine diphosphokinase [Campylobacter portucalensis]MSN97152.1 2-amino-4-hydroxy-6-hydroxymethyldihydropteridine diphosphokinase [Campylobacter portucalensis]
MRCVFRKNSFFELDEIYSLKKSKFFPYKQTRCDDFKYEFFLNLGGNLGNVQENFEKFFLLLKKDRRFCITQSSPIFLNKAFGYEKQPDFLNAVMVVKTSKSPNETLKILNHFERIFKRKRSFKNAPRTLDLDILYYKNLTLNTNKLTLPHPGVYDRIPVIFGLGCLY